MKHEEDIAKWEGDVRGASKVREIEHAEHGAARKEYTESIGAVSECIAALKKHAHDMGQAGAALAQ